MTRPVHRNFCEAARGEDGEDALHGSDVTMDGLWACRIVA
jgi:hypothetical protein